MILRQVARLVAVRVLEEAFRKVGEIAVANARGGQSIAIFGHVDRLSPLREQLQVVGGVVPAVPDQCDRGGVAAVAGPGLRDRRIHLLLGIGDPLRVVVAAIFQRQGDQPVAITLVHRQPDHVGPLGVGERVAMAPRRAGRPDQHQHRTPALQSGLDNLEVRGMERLKPPDEHAEIM